MQEFDLLVSIIEEQLEITREMLISKTRKRQIVELRMICANIIKKSNNNYTLEEIGGVINKDHATICHYLVTHHDLMTEKSKRDSKYKKTFEKISNLYVDRAVFIIEDERAKLMAKKKKILNELREVTRSLQKLDRVTTT